MIDVPEPVVAAVVWVVLGGLVLYARSRGWTAALERDHRAASTAALVVVLCAAVGSLLLLFVLGVAVTAPVAVSAPWVVRRASAAIAIAVAGAFTGHLDALTVARRATAARSQFRGYATLMVAAIMLPSLLKGASAISWAATLSAIAVIAFAIGTRWHHPPLPAADS